MPRVFICYRRADAEAYAGRIYDRLADCFPKEHLFMDVEAIAPGEDFVAAIDSAVGGVDIVLAVIGPTWAIATDGRRLLENANDFVRMELALALQRNVRVIPVLVGGATMPSAETLPQDLGKLTRLNAVEIRHTRFAADVDRLIEALPGSPPTPSRWQRVSGLTRRAGSGARTDRLVWALAIVQTLGVLAALGTAVAAPYRTFYMVMWGFLLLGVNGIVIGFLSHRRGVPRAARFGWTTAVISTVAWGFGILFPESLRVAPIVETQTFELGFRLFALAYGALDLFLGLRALVAIGEASASGRKP
jgi:hypothetical protein